MSTSRCTVFLAVLSAFVSPSALMAQYSTHATARAQQGIFIYRPTTPSGNIMIQPRAGLSTRSQQGVFIYRNDNSLSGNLAIPPRLALDAQSPTASPILQGSGIIDRVNPSSLVVDANGSKLVVKPDAAATIDVVGSATREFLKTGQMVKFRSVFDADGMAIEPLNQLAVVSLRPGQKAGATPDEVALKPVLLSADDNSSTSNLDTEATSLFIFGRINNISGNLLQVNAGTRTYKVELNSDAQIEIHTSDFSLARPGDRVTVRGYLEKPGIATASSIQISLDKAGRAKMATNSR